MNRDQCSLATAERSKQWFDDMDQVPLRFRCGGRVGTISTSLHEFARRIGEPHKAAPGGHWRDYDKPLLDGVPPTS